MIYEYPEVFIVPVFYVKDLGDNDMHRDKKYKSSHEDKLLIPNKELQEDGIFLAEMNIYGDFQYKDIDSLNTEGKSLQEPYNEFIINESKAHDSSEYQNIINNIDEEYANSETSGIYKSEY